MSLSNHVVYGVWHASKGWQAALTQVSGLVRLSTRHVLARAPVKNAEEDNSVAEVYLQLGPDSLETRAVIDLLEQARSCNIV